MPENDDPGVGESNDVEEFLREFDRVEYDETLIGLVGQGYDVNAPGDQAVADLLGAWRDDVGRVPVDESRFPSAHTASGKMPPITGGTRRMPINEDAAQVATMANDTTALSALGSCKERLDDALAAIAHASDHVASSAGTAANLLGGAEGETVNGQGQQVVQELSNLSGQIQAAIALAGDAEGYANAFNTALRDAAQRHGGGGS
jgi:hypothetical protein